MTNEKLIGIKFFQHNFIKWSYLYLGKAALTSRNKNTCILIFNPKTIELEKQKKFHPPENNIVDTELIINILPYSARKNIANKIDEYSTLYPATNSASASGRSKGDLLVSASDTIGKSNHNGNKGKIYHKSHWFDTISIREYEPLINTIDKNIVLIHIS